LGRLCVNVHLFIYFKPCQLRLLEGGLQRRREKCEVSCPFPKCAPSATALPSESRTVRNLSQATWQTDIQKKECVKEKGTNGCGKGEGNEASTHWVHIGSAALAKKKRAPGESTLAEMARGPAVYVGEDGGFKRVTIGVSPVTKAVPRAMAARGLDGAVGGRWRAFLKGNYAEGPGRRQGVVLALGLVSKSVESRSICPKTLRFS
jgi:hypothetical protein